ncbi:hypothetical protein ACM3BO_08365 [Mammaliicoccus sciuri]
MYTSAMLKEKPVVVQRALFDHYANLGLNEKQFVILIKLLDQENDSKLTASIRRYPTWHDFIYTRSESYH